MIPHCMLLSARGKELQARMTCRDHDLDAQGTPESCSGAPEITLLLRLFGRLLVPVRLQGISADGFISCHMQNLQDRGCHLLFVLHPLQEASDGWQGF